MTDRAVNPDGSARAGLPRRGPSVAVVPAGPAARPDATPTAPGATVRAACRPRGNPARAARVRSRRMARDGSPMGGRPASGIDPGRAPTWVVATTRAGAAHLTVRPVQAPVRRPAPGRQPMGTPGLLAVRPMHY